MKSTKDIWFATFLELNNHEVTDFNGTKKTEFFFEIKDDQWKKLRLDFLKSDTYKMKQLHSKLRDLNF